MEDIDSDLAPTVELLAEAVRRSGAQSAFVPICTPTGSAGDGIPGRVRLESPSGVAPIEIATFSEGLSSHIVGSYLGVGEGTTFEMPEESLVPSSSVWNFYADLISAVLRGLVVELIRWRGDEIVSSRCRIQVGDYVVINDRRSSWPFLSEYKEVKRYAPYPWVDTSADPEVLFKLEHYGTFDALRDATIRAWTRHRKYS